MLKDKFIYLPLLEELIKISIPEVGRGLLEKDKKLCLFVACLLLKFFDLKVVHEYES
jgi:hypothetical protein